MRFPRGFFTTEDTEKSFLHLALQNRFHFTNGAQEEAEYKSLIINHSIFNCSPCALCVLCGEKIIAGRLSLAAKTGPPRPALSAPAAARHADRPPPRMP